jgi:outer membrane protein assembly factor BamE (lipoprotein component of BamABCDE complex)
MLQEKMRSIVCWLVVAVVMLTFLHVYSLEGLDGLLFSTFLDEDTVYSAGYRDSDFRAIQRGMTESQVRTLLPAPLGEVWIYDNQAMVGFSDNRVDHVYLERPMPSLGAKVGMTKCEVLGVLGEPERKTLTYSRSKHDNSYHVRAVAFRHGKVSARLSECYVD